MWSLSLIGGVFNLFFGSTIFADPIAYFRSQKARTLAWWEAFFTSSLFVVAIYLVYLLLALFACQVPLHGEHCQRSCLLLYWG